MFWPIVLWSAPPNPTLHPIDQIQVALQQLGTTPGIPATAAVIGSALKPLMDRIVAGRRFRSYISNPRGASTIAKAARATENLVGDG